LNGNFLSQNALYVAEMTGPGRSGFWSWQASREKYFGDEKP
jgi:hypothetical protein